MANATTYFINSKDGLDSNNGTSQKTPWKSLKKINQTPLMPGDKVLFAAGSNFKGQFKPQGSGVKNSPIRIDKYGSGDKPQFDGEGKVLHTVYIFNSEYITVRNLEITNKGAKRKAHRRGLYIHIKDFGTAHDIKIQDLYIHDVNGSLVKKTGGGSAILWKNEGKQKKSRFDGLLIENCHLVRCTRNGINSKGYYSRDDWYPNLNVVIRKNLLEEIPGDGIVPIACDGALIEHNIMRDCPRMLPLGDAAAGIWPWSSDNTIIQYNEVSDHKAMWDGQGFDSDWNCQGTIIQYNYSHDNEGGFLLICNDGSAGKSWNIGNIGTIVRYNISINDGLRVTGKHAGFSPVFHISGPVKNTQIYNNIIYQNKKPSKKYDTKIVEMHNWGGPWPTNTWFANNIFYTENTAKWKNGKARLTIYENNMFFGKHVNRPKDTKAIFANPLFKKPGEIPKGIKNLQGYLLQKNSPAIGAALKINGNGGKDFWGNPVDVKGPTTIGATEVMP